MIWNWDQYEISIGYEKNLATFITNGPSSCVHCIVGKIFLRVCSVEYWTELRYSMHMEYLHTVHMHILYNADSRTEIWLSELPLYTMSHLCDSENWLANTTATRWKETVLYRTSLHSPHQEPCISSAHVLTHSQSHTKFPLHMWQLSETHLWYLTD